MKSVFFSTNIAPACLETDTHDLGFDVKLVETGWGYTLADRKSLMLHSQINMKMSFKLIPKF